MGFLRTASTYSAVVGVGGYYLLHRQLVAQFPDIPHYELPQSSKVKKFFPKQDSHEYIAYCDTFKTTVKTSKCANYVAHGILQWPTLKNLQDSEPSATATIQGRTLHESSTRFFHSTVLQWAWRPGFPVVGTFEWLASYGYPWRMMNGGLHEVLVENVGGDTYDVYFVTAHQYNNLRDGKLIPSLMQVFHRDFARVVLWFGTKDIK